MTACIARSKLVNFSSKKNLSLNGCKPLKIELRFFFTLKKFHSSGVPIILLEKNNTSGISLDTPWRVFRQLLSNF